ncbi:MAG: hypothetical protein ACRDSK_00965 [Actinophytocola sp.]|uniref:hypothetical protein n=1 Tax=Actinophytocola sp. TaxID=1872138 RepID=UPI003D6B610F
MSVVLLVLLVATVIVSVGLLASMYVKDEPFHGAMGLCLLLGLGTVLAFLYAAVAQV